MPSGSSAGRRNRPPKSRGAGRETASGPASRGPWSPRRDAGPSWPNPRLPWASVPVFTPDRAARCVTHFISNELTGQGQDLARKNRRDLSDDIKRLEKRLEGLTADMATLAANDAIPSQEAVADRRARTHGHLHAGTGQAGERPRQGGREAASGAGGAVEAVLTTGFNPGWLAAVITPPLSGSIPPRPRRPPRFRLLPVIPPAAATPR
jgi:hypothetical protein